MLSITVALSRYVPIITVKSVLIPKFRLPVLIFLRNILNIGCCGVQVDEGGL